MLFSSLSFSPSLICFIAISLLWPNGSIALSLFVDFVFVFHFSYLFTIKVVNGNVVFVVVVVTAAATVVIESNEKKTKALDWKKEL